jgi:hypothetical protein
MSFGQPNESHLRPTPCLLLIWWCNVQFQTMITVTHPFCLLQYICQQSAHAFGQQLVWHKCLQDLDVQPGNLHAIQNIVSFLFLLSGCLHFLFIFARALVKVRWRECVGESMSNTDRCKINPVLFIQTFSSICPLFLRRVERTGKGKLPPLLKVGCKQPLKGKVLLTN